MGKAPDGGRRVRENRVTPDPRACGEFDGRTRLVVVGVLRLVRHPAAVVNGVRVPGWADRLLTHAEPWRPYRSVATWYLWRSLDNGG
jgi:3-methyladenine DNA glycosylase/8-oxoguanine DNA glycosylase